jgi:hypothetical protein
LKKPKKERKKKKKKKKCGSRDTATNRPCQITIFPCTRHTPDGRRRPRKPNLQRLKLAENIPRSKSIAQAGRESGYSEAVVKARIYEIAKSPDVQEAIRESRLTVPVDSNEVTSEFDTAVDSNAVNQARAEFHADVEDLMWRAQDAGTPLTREEAIEKLKPVFAQLLSKAVFEAALNDSNVINKANANFDEAVDSFLQLAKKFGLTVSREFAASRLQPFLARSSS